MIDRIQQCQNQVAKKLLTTMHEKKSNLALAADVTKAEELLALAEATGPYICVLKTHIDIIEDFTSELPKKLRALADKYNFLIFEDRKFADIGNTVKLQFTKGVYQIAQWADIINAHGVMGSGIIDGLQDGADLNRHGLLLLAEISSDGNLAVGSYREEVIKMASRNPEFVIGFIAQKRLTDNPSHIVMTPGVSLSSSGDSLGQRYVTPEQALLHNGSDIIIVGRGIVAAKDPANEAKKYQLAGQKASNLL